MALKTINDPVHGTISLGNAEQQIINHRYFQRLRRIKALGLLEFAFPSARHSRFEHSIGAYHVAERLTGAIHQVTSNLAPSDKNKWNPDTEFQPVEETELPAIFSSEFIEATRIAALLHDIGHGPFSHASECLMPKRSEILASNPDASDYVRAMLEKSAKKSDQADHEDYSLLLADALLKELKIDGDRRFLILAIKCKDIEVPSEKKHLSQLISFFRNLVDGELDSDRMDYLLRDSLFCGVPYGKYDLERLLEGLVVLRNKKSELVLGIRRSSLSALEDFIFARFQMHVQIYAHKIDGSCNKAFEEIAKRSNKRLPAKLEDYAATDDENIVASIPELADFDKVRRHRALWPMVFESFSADAAIDSVLIQKFGSAIPKGYWAKKTSEKPIKKASLLDFPVVSKDLSGNLIAQKIKGLSQLVSNYNANFVVTRVFVSPEHAKAAENVRDSFGAAVTGTQDSIPPTTPQIKKTGS